jgi:LysM repeat protein
MSRRFPLVIAMSLGLAGCNLTAQQDSQFDDSRNSFYKQAQQDLDNNDPAAAAAAYESALAANPKLPGAHYQLGILYGEKLQDPVSSIYHYKRYLELAPNADHAENAKEGIDKESQAFAASLPSTTSQNSDEMTKLQTDNASLQKQVEDATHTIAQLQAQLAKAKHHHDATATANVPAPETPAPAPIPAATPVVAADATTPTPPAATDDTSTTNAPPAPAGPQRALPLDAPNPALEAAANTNAPGTAAPDAGPTRTYTVVKGDSLWKIAHKMYPGDTKNGVDKIQEANKDAIGGKPLKIGQVLVIPQ